MIRNFLDYFLSDSSAFLRRFSSFLYITLYTFEHPLLERQAQEKVETK